MSKSPSKYIFWPYDLYPYFLYGVSSEEKISDGHVLYYIESYQGFVKPSFVLPIQEGEALAKALEELRSNKRRAEKTIHDEFMRLLNSEIKQRGLKEIE